MAEVTSVPRRRRRQTTNRGGDRPKWVQLDLLRDLPVPCRDTPRPKPDEPSPAARPPAPPSQSPAPTGKTPESHPHFEEQRALEAKKQAAESPWGPRYSPISLNILRHHGPRLENQGAFLALIVMEDLIHGLGREDGRAVSQQGIAKAMGGVTTRSVRTYLKVLQEAGLVTLVSPGRIDHSAATYTLTHRARTPKSAVGPAGASITEFPADRTAENISAVQGDEGAGTAENASARTAENSSDTKRQKLRNQKNSRSRSRARDPTWGTAAATASVDNETDVDLDQWPESVKAIRSPELFPDLKRHLLVGIIQHTKKLQLTDDLYAGAVRSDGPALRLEHPRAPQLWGWRVAEEAARRIAERIREEGQHPESRPPPRERPVEESPPVEPTGRVRRADAPCTNGHRPLLVWITDYGEECCVCCKPPDDPKLRAEALQMMRG